MKKTNLEIGVVLSVFLLFCCSALSGCEGLARKFKRERKQDKKEEMEMVVLPEAYESGSVSKEDVYKKSYFFWKGWQEELINALIEGRSKKNQLKCLDEALINLNDMKALLSSEKEAALASYIKQMNDLRGSISKDISSMRIDTYRRTAQKLLEDIVEGFTYSRIKDSLK